MTESKKASGGWVTLGAIFVLYWIGAGIYQGYLFIDEQGYLPHTEETSITADSNWLVGETKRCDSVTMTKELGALKHQETGYALGEIYCDKGPAHNVKVQFYGRIVQPSHIVVNWDCTKESDSIFNSFAFTCKQTGAL